MDQAKYAQLFRTESREHLEEMDAALLTLEHATDSVHVASLIATLFRATHTIKGMAGSMGYMDIERVAHAMESLLDLQRARARAPEPDVLALLFDSTAALRITLDHAGSDVDLTAAVQQVLLRCAALSHETESVARPTVRGGLPRSTDASAVMADGASADGASADGATASATERIVDVRLSADCPLKGVRAMLVLARLRHVATVLAVTPPEHTWQEARFAGEVSFRISSSADASQIEQAIRGAGEVARVSVRSTIAVSRVDEATRTVRVDLRRLDALLDLVGELVITRDRLVREHDAGPEQGAGRALARAVQDTARLVTALQDEVMQARMVPLGQVFDRFPRLVRDIARDLGKKVRLETEGREIELDRSLLDAIGDPIVHLLRNALDHGIEEPAIREALGKSPTGTLTLRAARDRAAIVLRVEDDGRGIDRAAILIRAHEQGLVAPQVTTLDDERLLAVLAHPGFSTSRAVTSISGRGVGVDVVQHRIRALGGSLSLETLSGAGTVFTLRLPGTLAIIRALLVEVDAVTYALPVANVVEVADYTTGMNVTSRAPTELQLRDECFALVHLRERFGCPSTADEQCVVVVESSGRRAAVLVDRVLLQQDIVVKPLDVARGGVALFSGATVLGDGIPALIVDVGSLC